MSKDDKTITELIVHVLKKHFRGLEEKYYKIIAEEIKKIPEYVSGRKQID